MKFAFLLLVLKLLNHYVCCERILAAVLMPSYSHQMFYQPLWRELAIRGHEVVVITTDPTNETLPNFREISINESYRPIKEYTKLMLNTSLFKIMWENKWMEASTLVTEFQLQLPQVQELINNETEHFDLLMIEHFITPGFGFQHRFKCPMIGVVSLDALPPAHEMMGNADHYVLYPFGFFTFDEKLSLLERLIVTFFGVFANFSQFSYLGKMTDSGRKFFGKDMPPIGEIFERTDMLFVNANPVFSAIRPHTPSTISMAGGMHMRPEKPLPKFLQTYLDNASNGAIYFSLGSNVKSNELDLELRQTIMSTFSQLPYKIIWKFEDDTLPGKPDNVMITKWAQQQDILRHKNIKLFITQGGLQSLEESLYSYVPNVVMPFFGDQAGNAAKVRNKGLGLIVDRHNLKIEDFKAAILEVIDNPKYRETSKRYATQIQDSPLSPLENAVWWTEYVLRHRGAQHLKGPRIPLYQYYYFDVMFVLGSIMTIILGLVISLIVYTVKGIRFLFYYNVHKENTTEKMKTS